MKLRLLTITTILLLLASCTTKTRVEEQMIICGADIFAEHNINLLDTIRNYEQLLIAEGFLKDPSGASYYTLSQQLINNLTSFTKSPSKAFYLLDGKEANILANCFKEI